jgi:hypothetical protein
MAAVVPVVSVVPATQPDDPRRTTRDDEKKGE